tara:strand:+ start:802 stop:1254 length:453 start_codon:yes stop_codon:yes gene_type:complete
MKTVNNITESLDWKCQHTWKQSAINTLWCLVGCAFGDMMTIYYFQVNNIPWPTLHIMALAMLNGIIASIILETIILLKQMTFQVALKTAFGMSLISMISMELAMNIIDVYVTGGAKLTLEVIPLMLLGGFLTPWPYNYWRLKKYGIGCCG